MDISRKIKGSQTGFSFCCHVPPHRRILFIPFRGLYSEIYPIWWWQAATLVAPMLDSADPEWWTLADRWELPPVLPRCAKSIRHLPCGWKISYQRIKELIGFDGSKPVHNPSKSSLIPEWDIWSTSAFYLAFPHWRLQGLAYLEPFSLTVTQIHILAGRLPWSWSSFTCFPVYLISRVG